MANQVAARLYGDDYQHLYAWYHVLELLMPRKRVARARIEDEDAGSADDVTVSHEPGSNLPNRFYQIKYHVDQRSQYSTETFIDAKPNETSQLTKLFRTWLKLTADDPARKVEIHFVSNWSWEGADKLKNCLDGHDSGLKEDFFKASRGSDIGKLRSKWGLHLDCPAAQFIEFCESLRLKPGFDCWKEMQERVVERMDTLRLKSDESSLWIAQGIVRKWIKEGPKDVTRDILVEEIAKADLNQPPDEEPSVHLYLIGIKDQKFDIEPDYKIDWREHFLGSPNTRGHELKDPKDWNALLLPELQSLESTINQDTSCRLIRVRGMSRLSIWFAFGFTFSEVNRYTIEVAQREELWRTDAEPSPDFGLFITSADGSIRGEDIDGDGTTVAVGISVSGPLEDDVRLHLTHRTEKVSALLFLAPTRGLGSDCVRGAGDAVALAAHAKMLVREFVKARQATRLLLYYFGPLSGACFIGHRLNAVCREIQIMENQQPGYSPSFTL